MSTCVWIPGGEVLVLMEGLRKPGIDFVLTKHENCAGFMAEGGFHADGAPGILVATIGPGVANAVNVVANAFQDRVPMIFLTGCVDAHDALTYTHQVFDHGELLKSVTKASIKVVDGAVDVSIDKAIAIALDGQPGPVHVDLPISLASKSQPASTMIVRTFPSHTHQRKEQNWKLPDSGSGSATAFDNSRCRCFESECGVRCEGIRAGLRDSTDHDLQSKRRVAGG
ncbi:MAG: hypothetical protein Ct9H300mP21_02720 [Pseudomonadota bacterium]|nr:MAG: hypothetical protein Ct9H300mP21_02720 [Pseudomonadota bacterium]